MLRLVCCFSVCLALSLANAGCGRREPPLPTAQGTSVRLAPSGVVSHIVRDEVRKAGEQAQAVAPPRLVVLTSVDGLAPYVRASCRTPTLDRLAKEGTSFDNATTIMPSITLPSHTSMLSGLTPSEHQVYWNSYDADKRITAPTVFTQCRNHALRCGLFAAKEKFVHFAEAEPGVQRYEYLPSADQVVAQAIQYITEERPDFVFIHLAEVDGAGHMHGWNSPEQRAAIEGIDAQLARLKAALDATGRKVSWIISADHGGHGRGHGEDTPSDRVIPWIGYGDGIQKLGVVSSPRPVSTTDTAATVLALLRVPAPRAITGRAVALEPPAAANGVVH